MMGTILENEKKIYFDTHNIWKNSTIIYPIKMEYGWNFWIFSLKMMVKSVNFFLKSLHAQNIFFHRSEDFCPKLQIH